MTVILLFIWDAALAQTDTDLRVASRQLKWLKSVLISAVRKHENLDVITTEFFLSKLLKGWDEAGRQQDS
jgi:hypothetical protein